MPSVIAEVQKAALPTGVVTLLFTDVVGSTQGWERHHAAFGAAMQRHFRLIEDAVARHGGGVFKTMGDAVCAAFASAADAARAAVDAQRALHNELWTEPPGPLHVRIALHTGDPVCRDGDYFGPPVNRVARLTNAAHGGQILVSAVTRDALRHTAPDIETRPLGVHMLKDLQHPEALFQIVAPGLPADFPPPRTLDARPHNLPVQLTSFVGRSEEMADLDVRLEDPATRLVTLLGPPGVGKTRLATQFAASIAYRYPDGVWLVELANVRDPGMVAHQIASALHIEQADGRPAADRLYDALAERRLLLICDNFEHVLPAADVISGLLRATKNVQALVTSRSLLRVRGESVMEVGPLEAPRPRAGILAVDLVDCPATALFVERGGAARPHWEPANADAAPIVELCRDLDGLPLAIELAAARMRSMTLGDIRARLSDRFRLLAAGSVDLPERQRTLRAALDWSFDLLSPTERETLAQLGVFRGGFTLDAAEAVCNAGDVWEVVPSLHDQSFLVARERSGMMRYTMLEAVREYACERLGEKAEERRAAHAAYFLPLAEAASNAQDTAGDAEAFDRLDADVDNLRAAITWSTDAGHAETAARLTAAMTEFFRRRGWWVERMDRIESALSLARTHADRHPATAWLFYHHANALLDMGRLEEAEASAHEARRRAMQRQDALLNVRALVLLGLIAARRKDRVTAERHYAEAVGTAERGGDTFGLASALHNQGKLADEAGDAGSAVAFYQRALPIWRSTGAARGLAATLTNLGFVADETESRRADETGDAEEAKRHRAAAIALYAEALGLQLALLNLPSVALLLNNMGEVLERDGQPADALPLYVAAEELFRRAGSQNAAYVAQQRERAMASLGENAEAATRHAAALDPLETARAAAQMAARPSGTLS